jgi:hypothetical protein
MRLTILLIVVFLFHRGYTQDALTRNWLITSNLGIEKHDKRLFDYSEKDMLLEMQAESWGTYHWNVSINRKVGQVIRLSVFANIGVEHEIATFLRPFDHLYFEKDFYKILRNLNKYEKVKIPLSFIAFYKIFHNTYVNAGISSYVLIYRKIDHTENNSDAFPYTEFTMEPNNVELTAGLNRTFRRFLFGLNTRLVNYQKIDKILFNSIIKDPRTNKNWEFYNPLQFEFSIGYTW